MKNIVKSKLMKTLTGMAVAMLIPSGAAMAALSYTNVWEDFENDTVGVPPSNAQIGTWQVGTVLDVLGPGGNRPSNAAEQYVSGLKNGYLKAATQASIVGTPVQFEFDLHYIDGYVAFGLTTDATATSRAGQQSSALAYLMFQDASGNATLGVNALKAGGTATDHTLTSYQNMASQSAFHNGDNPFSGGQYYDHIEFGYVVGDATGTLKINGSTISSSVTLVNSGGIVDGVFFMGNGGTENYVIDNVLVTSVVPEPTTLALTCLGVAGLILGRRRKI